MGTLRTPNSLRKPWGVCLKACEIETRFTVHGLRRTFVDLARRAGVNAVVARTLTGHVTEQMLAHYSTVELDENRDAVVAILKLVSDGTRGDRGGDREFRVAAGRPTKRPNPGLRLVNR